MAGKLEVERKLGVTQSLGRSRLYLQGVGFAHQFTGRYNPVTLAMAQATADRACSIQLVPSFITTHTLKLGFLVLEDS
ncbi:hypothetical protein AUG19_08950 [archaeon 13_1_20CM_2_54_9]|nr:MAG: hypothetical protein AUJ07_01925 [Crenarchaeota archaeon 13_1_40CM_3_53_5]OLE74354.1 MAG: hypothetical protein AUG19_08950 [archaeon 13_1_20CM_2_54_9]